MKWTLGVSLFLFSLTTAQQLQNSDNLASFSKKINANTEVSNILFIGDSHIQAGYVTEVLRNHFQENYGNAGRGLVFPYDVANSKGPHDFTSVSNQAWQTFRSVYDQDVFDQMGALGFVMGNQKESFLEIDFNNIQDIFDRVIIFNDQLMSGDEFKIYKSNHRLSDYVSTKRTLQKYTVQEGETYPELAAKFNVVTTRLLQLNGRGITNPKPGQTYTVEKAEPVYRSDFENNLTLLASPKFTGNRTEYNYSEPQQKFIMNVNSDKNIFYGFQFLNSKADRGVVFNTVGVNGATYKDFLKFPLQIEQLKTTDPDLLIVSLGTNESVSSISKADFLVNVQQLIRKFRENDNELPVLLISPTDNNMNSKKAAEVVEWLQEASSLNHVAFLNMYEATGGKGYFTKAQKSGRAQSDGVHFLPKGYTEQGEKIWTAIHKFLSN